MSQLMLYNSLTRRKEPFEPIDPKNVRMYVCGMTVYDYCHIGHGRLLVAFDAIARWLRQLGYPLTYARNVTDVDDKIIKRANENNESPEKLARRFERLMREDALALGSLPPDLEPRATENMQAIVDMVRTLVDKGTAYVAPNGDVYYSVRKFPQYGQLSGKSIDDLQAGKRVEIGEGKRDPLDFALWKAAKPNEPSWDSDWGKGRPGWHIECSAMGLKCLGETFDLHGGGADLQFPHHENEIAQSCAALGCASAAKGKMSHVKYWLHNGFIRVNEEKMSKSLRNFTTIRDALKLYDGETLRFFILRSHYRSPLNYSEDNLTDAKNSLDRLYTALNQTPPASGEFKLDPENDKLVGAFYDAMNDDFNTTGAIAALFEAANAANKSGDARDSARLKALGGILGLLQQEPEAFFRSGGAEAAEGAMGEEEIDKLIQQRAIARKNKDWKESDRIRDLLAQEGILLEDSPQGTLWKRK